MITDIEAQKAMNTIIAYCGEMKCENCAISSACEQMINGDEAPTYIKPYELEEMDDLEETDELLHSSFVDHDGNVVFVD